jgi:hypothetical protein
LIHKKPTAARARRADPRILAEGGTRRIAPRVDAPGVRGRRASAVARHVHQVLLVAENGRQPVAVGQVLGRVDEVRHVETEACRLLDAAAAQRGCERVDIGDPAGVTGVQVHQGVRGGRKSLNGGRVTRRVVGVGSSATSQVATGWELMGAKASASADRPSTRSRARASAAVEEESIHKCVPASGFSGARLEPCSTQPRVGSSSVVAASKRLNLTPADGTRSDRCSGRGPELRSGLCQLGLLEGLLVAGVREEGASVVPTELALGQEADRTALAPRLVLATLLLGSYGHAETIAVR